MTLHEHTARAICRLISVAAGISALVVFVSAVSRPGGDLGTTICGMAFFAVLALIAV